MSVDQGHKRIDTYPYRYADQELGFNYESYELNNGKTGSLDDTINLDLSDEDGWDEGALTVSVEVTDNILERVFPPSPPYDGAIVVVAYCPTNHYRFESVIEDAPLSSGEYSGIVGLELEKFRGRVELTPLLVRTTPLGSQPAGHTDPPFAERTGRKLAHGLTGTVDVDEPTGNKSKDLPVIPRSFSDAPFPADDGNTWYLDMTDESSPRLYVNSDHGFVVPLFKDKGQHGKGRVRQLVVDLQGTQMMTQFVIQAAELYVVHGEMKYPWQRRMLTEVCDDLFGAKSPDEVEDMLEPGTLSDTLNQVATAIQRRRAPHESLERVLELDL